MQNLILEVPMAMVGLISDIVVDNTDEISFKRLDGTELTDHKSLLEQAFSLMGQDEYLDEQQSVGILNVNVLADLAHEMGVNEKAFLERWVLNLLSAPRLNEVIQKIINVCGDVQFLERITHEELLSELQEALNSISVDSLALFHRVMPVAGSFKFELCAYYRKEKYVLFNAPVSGFVARVYQEVQLFSIVDKLRALCWAWEKQDKVRYSDKCFSDVRQAYTGILVSSPAT